MLVAAVNEWRVRDFGRLNYAETMRVVVPGVTLAVLGYQTILVVLLPEPAEHAAALSACGATLRRALRVALSRREREARAASAWGWGPKRSERVGPASIENED